MVVAGERKLKSHATILFLHYLQGDDICNRVYVCVLCNGSGIKIVRYVVTIALTLFSAFL